MTFRQSDGACRINRAVSRFLMTPGARNAPGMPKGIYRGVAIARDHGVSVAVIDRMQAIRRRSLGARRQTDKGESFRNNGFANGRRREVDALQKAIEPAGLFEPAAKQS